MFNKQKPYGTVFGISAIPGLKYEQDGKFYDAKLREIDRDGNLVGVPNAVPMPTPEPELSPVAVPPPAAEPPPKKKLRIFDLARVYEMTPTDLIDKLTGAGFEIKSHMMTVTDEIIEWCRDRLATTAVEKAPEPKEEDPLPAKPRTYIIGGGGQ